MKSNFSFRGPRSRSPLEHLRLRLEHLEDRSLLSAAPITSVFLPPQHDLFNYSGYLTGPSSQSPITIAENYLRSHASDLGILAADIDNYIVSTNYVTKDTGATTLTFTQSLHGLPVARANYNMTVAADGRLLAVAGGFVPGLSAQNSQPMPQPPMNAQQAIVSAAQNLLGISLADLPALIASHGGTSTYRAPLVSLDDIPARLQYAAAPGNTVSLSWNITARIPDNTHWYNASIDSSTGNIVALTDYSSDAQYEVVPLPGRNPDDIPRTVVTDPQVPSPTPATVPSPFGWHDTNGVDGAEFTITTGNNVNAYADRDDDNLPDSGSQPDGGAGLNFVGPLVPVDPTQAPQSYTAAAVVNLFYWSNILHDVHYAYGFDEAARNFQTNNYGRGGSGGDAVNSEAQDGGGTNNANFATPPDGIAPRMQMYEFTATTPRRDGDFEPSIIVHEYGHGVSNRLTGNGAGLDALQSGGMGEGWGDWWSLMFSHTSITDTTTPRGVGTYVLGQPITGPGIRAFKYGFSIGNQALETFLNYGLGPGQDVEVHEAGTRWAATLWDITHVLEVKYGFNANLYDSTSLAGNIRAMHLVTTALKIQPLNPTFIQSRDAILMADQLLYGGANQIELWTAFARRGLGQFASTSGSDSTVLTTSFVVPNPAASLAFNVSTLEGDSGLTNLVFTVNLAGVVSQTSTIVYTTVNGTAQAGADYLPSSGTLTFVPNGPTTQFITVEVIGDEVVEANETFQVVLSNPVNIDLGISEATGTILNDDAEVSIDDVFVIEGDSGTKNAVFTVNVIGDPTSPVSFTYSTLNGTAQGGTDYLARAGAVTLVQGPSSMQITVPVVGDTLSEGNEVFFVLLSSVQGARLSKGTGVGTIIDNEPTPALYVNDVRITTISSGVYVAVFTVALNRISGQDVSVAFHTTDGSALAGIDYDQQNGVLTIPAGAISRQISVPVYTSEQYAPNKKFSLNLSAPTHANLNDAEGVATVVFAEGPVGEYIIDNGAVGFSQSTGWTNLTNTYGYDLDYQHHAAGSGSGAATWTFANVGAGSFEVFARWVPFVNWASNAPYTILDGSTPLATVQVNQKVAPVGDQSNGIVWQSLGTFQSNSGTLAVRLNDNANGYVVADAIRIVANGIPQQKPEMDLAGADHSIATGDTTPSASDATLFDSVQANWGSLTHTFSIGNNGNADLHLTGGPTVAISGANASDFSITAWPATTITPGGTTDFQVLFHPTGVGLRTATISVANDDTDEEPYTFTVQGTGFGPGQTTLTIDDSSLGFSKIGSWTPTGNVQAQAGAFLASDAGVGGDVATWDFTNLAQGTYDVYASWVPFVNRATNAPFVVSNLAGNSFSVPVNEQLAPTIELNSALWGSLGSIDVTNGRLRVTLSDNADGFVAADSILVVRRDTQADPLAQAHNLALPADVNGDAKVTGRDLLLVINTLIASSATANGISAAPLTAVAQTTVQNWYVDVNGDGAVTPRDALAVINYLLAQSAAAPQAVPQAEPETASFDGLLLAAIDQALSDELETDDLLELRT